MLEWWQALLIALAGTLGTGGVALLLQSRQQRHDAKRQLEQFREERRTRMENALREHLRDRAKGIYEFLEVIEREQGRRFLRDILSGSTSMKAEVYQAIQNAVDPVTWDQLWQEFVAAETWPVERWQDVIKQYSGRFFALGDRRLRDMLFELLGHFAARDKTLLTDAQVAELLQEAKERIAQTIVELNSPELGPWEPAV